jgi:hypothetical protein
MHTSTSEKTAEDGKQYVLVKVDDNEAVTPEEGSSNVASVGGEEEELAAPVQCPAIVYKVQYKDFSGEIKGTKLLDAPYKLTKPS